MIPENGRDKKGVEGTVFKSPTLVGTQLGFDWKADIQPLQSLDGLLQLSLRDRPTFADSMLLGAAEPISLSSLTLNGVPLRRALAVHGQDGTTADVSVEVEVMEVL